MTCCRQGQKLGVNGERVGAYFWLPPSLHNWVPALKLLCWTQGLLSCLISTCFTLWPLTRRKWTNSFYSLRAPIVDSIVLRGCCLLFDGPSCWGSTLLAVKFKLNLILKSLISQLLQRIWCWIFQFKQEIVIWKQCSKFIMPFALQTKFDYIAHKIADGLYFAMQCAIYNNNA